MTSSQHFRRAQFGLATDGKKDSHHLLWSRHDWQNGFAGSLRAHPYFVIRIPQDSLHRQIHQEMTNIPLPGGSACHRALDLLTDAMDKKRVRVSQDTPQERLEFLLAAWNNVPSARQTVLALRQQLEIFQAYERSTSSRLVALPPYSLRFPLSLRHLRNASPPQERLAF